MTPGWTRGSFLGLLEDESEARQGERSRQRESRWRLDALLMNEETVWLGGGTPVGPTESFLDGRGNQRCLIWGCFRKRECPTGAWAQGYWVQHGNARGVKGSNGICRARVFNEERALLSSTLMSGRGADAGKNEIRRKWPVLKGSLGHLTALRSTKQLLTLCPMVPYYV